MNKDINGKYRHYKGKEYEIMGIARHSETLAELVVYRGLYEDPEFGPNPIWVRPKEMFFDEVEVEGVIKPRFTQLSDK